MKVAAAADTRSSQSTDPGIALPTGAVMPSEEKLLDSQIDRMFELRRQVQTAWAGTKQRLADEIELADEDDDEARQASANKRPKIDSTSATPPLRAQGQVTLAGATFETTSPDSVLRAPAQLDVPFFPRKASKAPAHAPPEPPGVELTGVPFGLLRLCATMSSQIYTANDLSDFDLTNPSDKSVTAQPILFDDHGDLKDLVPPFCVAASGSCLILAWRGSATVMDWVTDFGAAPVSSTRWNQVSSEVKAHGGYASLVESELAAHEGFILQQIRSRKIDTVLLTGHSLAGGMATVAHLFLEGQLRTNGSAWYPLQKTLTVRSVAIAAPMTTLVCAPDDAHMDDATRTLLSKIATHSCNLVYGPDIVPHGGGDIAYALDVAEALIPGAVASLPFNWVMRAIGVQRIANSALDTIMSKDSAKALAKALVQYRHVGTVIYYPAEAARAGKSRPVAMRDCQFLADSLPTFRGNAVVKVPSVNGKNSTSVPDQIKFAHSFLLQSFAYNVETAGTDATKP